MMIRKPLDLPPGVARDFIKDMEGPRRGAHRTGQRVCPASGPDLAVEPGRLDGCW